MPAVYRKTTEHARWYQIAKTSWHEGRRDVSGVDYVDLNNLSSVDLDPALKTQLKPGTKLYMR